MSLATEQGKEATKWSLMSKARMRQAPPSISSRAADGAQAAGRGVGMLTDCPGRVDSQLVIPGFRRVRKGRDTWNFSERTSFSDVKAMEGNAEASSQSAGVLPT